MLNQKILITTIQLAALYDMGIVYRVFYNKHSWSIEFQTNGL